MASEDDRRVQKRNKNIFVDSTAFFALFHNGDKWNKEAIRIYDKLKTENYTLVTTNLIIAETHQLILARLDSIKARNWLKLFYTNPEVNILTSSEDVEKKARDIIFKYLDKDFSLADAVSFVIMEELLRTQIAFAFDRHFQQKSFCLAKVELL
jgi:predicted nucleic acid-binding protein